MSPLQETEMFFLKQMIKQHHSLYRIPIKAEYWEDIFDTAVNKRDDDRSISHDTGHDTMDEAEGISYQNKSGVIKMYKGEKILEWSGHRTGSYDTIQDKVDFISSQDIDYYVFLARDDKEWGRGIKKYHLIKIASDFIKYNELNWSPHHNKNGKHIGYKTDDGDLSASITFSMSHQLWTKAKFNYIEDNAEIHTIEI